MNILRRLGSLLIIVATGLAWSSVSHAGVVVDVDREALNRVLAAIAATRVDLPVAEGRSLAVELRDLVVTGLEPGNPEGRSPGSIRTSVRVVMPEIGLDVVVQPRLSMQVVEADGQNVVELRFEEVALDLPLMGRLDLARFVAPMRYPAENAWFLAGAQGDVKVVSRVVRVSLNEERVRFEIDVVVPPSP